MGLWRKDKDNRKNVLRYLEIPGLSADPICYNASFPITRLQWFKAVHESPIDLTLKLPRKSASENVVCLCRLLNILANFSNLFLHTGKQCGPRSDCSYRSSLIWVHTVCRNDF